ncbi:MAG: hypothetical protein IPL32_01755 [Chloracidobacterium sp.]|nr:hypothetical protein [Chloracidobacterium sp.]
MNCPGCGTFVEADQQFCRSCGAGLLAEERPTIPWQFWGLAMAFGGILIALTGKMIDISWLVFPGVFISIGGMFMIAAIPLLRRSGPRKRKVAPLPQRDSLAPAGTTNKLLPIGENDFVPSVVENTTELLKTIKPR